MVREKWNQRLRVGVHLGDFDALDVEVFVAHEANGERIKGADHVLPIEDDLLHWSHGRRFDDETHLRLAVRQVRAVEGVRQRLLQTTSAVLVQREVQSTVDERTRPRRARQLDGDARVRFCSVPSKPKTAIA